MSARHVFSSRLFTVHGKPGAYRQPELTTVESCSSKYNAVERRMRAEGACKESRRRTMKSELGKVENKDGEVIERLSGFRLR